jgi:hypothetical protein
MTITPTIQAPGPAVGAFCSVRARRAIAVASAPIGALIVWTVSHFLGGVDLVVGTGTGARTVGPGSVVVVSLLAAGAAVGLAALLSRWTQRPRRTWQILAATVLVLSLLGPLGGATALARLSLVSLHLVVGLGLILGIRPTIPAARAEQ